MAAPLGEVVVELFVGGALFLGGFGGGVAFRGEFAVGVFLFGFFDEFVCFSGDGGFGIPGAYSVFFVALDSGFSRYGLAGAVVEPVVFLGACDDGESHVFVEVFG